MNKAILCLGLIGALFVTGCEQVSKSLVSSNFDNIPEGHCRRYKVNSVAAKSDSLDLKDNSRVDNE
jgi:hypothetical protein